MLAARISMLARARSGMTLTALPPSVTIRDTIEPAGSCCRAKAIAVCATTSASRALTPSEGAAAAWAARPSNSTSHMHMARDEPPTTSFAAACAIMASDTSSKKPSSIRSTFPPVVSSAGVPSTLTVRLEFLGHGRQRQRCPHRAGRVHVVTAGMADGGQGVVLYAECHHKLAGSEARAECRGLRRLWGIEAEPCHPQYTPHPLGGTELLAAKLRIRVDGVAQIKNLRLPALHRGLEGGFDIAPGGRNDAGPSPAAARSGGHAATSAARRLG